MATTYGNIKFRLTKAFPGVDADLVEGWITDCYQEILGVLPWVRLDVQWVIQTTAPYTTGTANVTAGSNAVSLTGGTWTNGLNGFTFRVSGDDDEYTFTYVDGTDGTLDRPYDGTTNTAATYAIYRVIYPMPADCRYLDPEAFASFKLGTLRKLDTEEAQGLIVPSQGCPPYSTDDPNPWPGLPRLWWPVMDDNSSPPNMQVRFFPIPDQVYSIPVTYSAEQVNPGSTSTVMLAWVQPAALIEGSTAKIKRHLKDYVGAKEAKDAYGDAMAVMLSQESYRRGPTQMRMADYYTRHRLRKWYKP